MASLIQPLSSQVPIVDDEGKPLPSFITMLQKLGVGTGLDGSSGSIALAAMAAKTILANKTGGSAAPTACTISDILDFVSTTRGHCPVSWSRRMVGIGSRYFWTVPKD
jgi:hypothetical protein